MGRNHNYLNASVSKIQRTYARNIEKSYIIGLSKKGKKYEELKSLLYNIDIRGTSKRELHIR